MGKHTDDERKMLIFQAKAIKNTNRINIRNVGFAFEGKEFDDEKIDVVKDIMNGDEKSIEIIENVQAKFFKANFTNNYLTTHKRLPVMYASVIYNRPLLMGVLFNMTLYFEISNDTNKIKSYEQLVTMNIDGKFTMEISMDEKKELIPVESFSGYSETVKNILTLLRTKDMVDIINFQLKKRHQERIARFGNPADYKPPVPKYNFDELVKNYKLDDED